MSTVSKEVQIKKLSSIRVRARECYRSNDIAGAIALYAKILEKQKKNLEAIQMLGTLHQRLGKLVEAEKYFRVYLKINKKNHEVYHQLGTVLQSVGQTSEALLFYEKATRLNRDFFDAWVAMGNLHAASGALGDSIKAYHGALNANPNHPIPLCNLGNVLADSGKPEEAYKQWGKALIADPKYSSAHSNMLLCMNYDNQFEGVKIYEAHRNWAEAHLRVTRRYASHNNSLDPARLIRIAYLSPDFREHSVAFFIKPIIRSHDRSKFHLTIYSSVSSPDRVTAEIELLTDEFRNISGISDADAARLIYADKIDILVDLSGHTSGNRLLVFGQKPAPIQVSYLGYPNTTGLDEMDYRITDSVADPVGKSKDFYSEELLRMPNGFLCYEPPKSVPVAPCPPCIERGYVTFGSFNYTAKIGAAVVDAWSDILKAVPESRLLLKYRSFSDACTQNHFLDMFIARGVESDRLSFMGLTVDKSKHMQSYNDVDIALDAFPYNGTTTTCDTLWMGVPVVVLTGNTHAGRVGVSLLAQIGLVELVADSVESYIALAIQLANDKGQLVEYRKGLRDRLQNSSLCDAESFVRDLEHEWRQIWSKYCVMGLIKSE